MKLKTINGSMRYLGLNSVNLMCVCVVGGAVKMGQFSKLSFQFGIVCTFGGARGFIVRSYRARFPLRSLQVGQASVQYDRVRRKSGYSLSPARQLIFGSRPREGLVVEHGR